MGRTARRLRYGPTDATVAPARRNLRWCLPVAATAFKLQHSPGGCLALRTWPSRAMFNIGHGLATWPASVRRRRGGWGSCGLSCKSSPFPAVQAVCGHRTCTRLARAPDTGTRRDTTSRVSLAGRLQNRNTAASPYAAVRRERRLVASIGLARRCSSNRSIGPIA